MSARDNGPKLRFSVVVMLLAVAGQIAGHVERAGTNHANVLHRAAGCPDDLVDLFKRLADLRLDVCVVILRPLAGDEKQLLPFHKNRGRLERCSSLDTRRLYGLRFHGRI